MKAVSYDRSISLFRRGRAALTFYTSHNVDMLDHSVACPLDTRHTIVRRKLVRRQVDPY